MVKAMAKKTVLERVTSMQQAVFDRSIIKCSGSFATYYFLNQWKWKDENERW
jgi:hypothetical protein